jgi:hypothetical protein
VIETFALQGRLDRERLDDGVRELGSSSTVIVAVGCSRCTPLVV